MLSAARRGVLAALAGPRPAAGGATLSSRPPTKRAPLTDQEREAELAPLLDAGWTMVPGQDAIQKTFRFGTFRQAWSFMGRVAEQAERVNHHPDWSNSYGRVHVALTSHDVRGLSRRDLKMAAFVDEAARVTS